MVWKPKDKELTKEEAIALAKKELEPYWIGSVPLIGAVRLKKDQPAQVYPLDPAYMTGAWITLFCDPYSYDGVSALTFFREWSSRYSALGIRFLLVMRSEVRVETQSAKTFGYLRRSGADFPIAIDVDNTIGDAFRIKTPAKLIISQNGRMLLEFASNQLTTQWFHATEAELQKFLRKADRGLPLQKVFSPKVDLIGDAEKIPIGSSQLGWEKKIQLSGKNVVEPGRIVIRDNGAALTLKFTGTNLGVLAQSQKPGSNCKVILEVDGKPAFDTFTDKDLVLEESGLSTATVSELNFYLLLKGLRRGQHELRLIFPTSEFNPIALYRFVVGN